MDIITIIVAAVFVLSAFIWINIGKGLHQQLIEHKLPSKEHAIKVVSIPMLAAAPLLLIAPGVHQGAISLFGVTVVVIFGFALFLMNFDSIQEHFNENQRL